MAHPRRLIRHPNQTILSILQQAVVIFSAVLLFETRAPRVFERGESNAEIAKARFSKILMTYLLIAHGVTVWIK
jgi:hypothetical protein